MTVPGKVCAACVCRGPTLCTPDRQQGERLTETQDQRIRGELHSQTCAHSACGVPPHREAPSTHPPACLQWAGGYTHSFPANAQLGPETENKHITSLLDLGSADRERRRGKTGRCGWHSTHRLQAPGGRRRCRRGLIPPESPILVHFLTGILSPKV